MTDDWTQQIDQTWSERNKSENATQLAFAAGNDTSEEYMVEEIWDSTVFINTFHKYPARADSDLISHHQHRTSNGSTYNGYANCQGIPNPPRPRGRLDITGDSKKANKCLKGIHWENILPGLGCSEWIWSSDPVDCMSLGLDLIWSTSIHLNHPRLIDTKGLSQSILIPVRDLRYYRSTLSQYS